MRLFNRQGSAWVVLLLTIWQGVYGQTAPPTFAPTFAPTFGFPTFAPVIAPTAAPTVSPTSTPTFAPSLAPTTAAPTQTPTFNPTAAPTSAPTTSAPTSFPTSTPTSAPSLSPTTAPSSVPTSVPTSAPSGAPTSTPTSAPSGAPTSVPTSAPSGAPTSTPTSAPSGAPTSAPSSAPSGAPTSSPSSAPSSAPSGAPTSSPTSAPSTSPSAAPSSAPTSTPTSSPTSTPTATPTSSPTSTPTASPTYANVTVSYFYYNIITEQTSQINDGDDLVLTTTNWTILLTVEDGSSYVSSVQFGVSESSTLSTKALGDEVTDNSSPYYAAGESDGSVEPIGITDSGTYTLSVGVFTESGASGTELLSDTLSFTVTYTTIAATNTDATTSGWVISGVVVGIPLIIEVVAIPAIWANPGAKKTYTNSNRPAIDLILFLQFTVGLMLVDGFYPTWYADFLSSFLWLLGIIDLSWFTNLATDIVSDVTCASMESATANTNSLFRALSIIGVPICSVFFVVLMFFISANIIVTVVFALGTLLNMLSERVRDREFLNFTALYKFYCRTIVNVWTVFFFPLILTAALQLSLPDKEWVMTTLAGIVIVVVGLLFSAFAFMKVYPYTSLNDEGKRELLGYYGPLFENYRNPDRRLFFMALFVKELASGLVISLFRKEGAAQISLVMSILFILCMAVVFAKPYVDRIEQVLILLIVLVQFIQTGLAVAMILTDSSSTARTVCAIVSLSFTGAIILLYVLLAIRKLYRMFFGKKEDSHEGVQELAQESEGSAEKSLPPAFYQQNDMVVEPASQVDPEERVEVAS